MKIVSNVTVTTGRKPSSGEKENYECGKREEKEERNKRKKTQ